MTNRMGLRDALEQHRQSTACLGSYESYRKEACAHGYIIVGGRKVTTEKLSGRWTVSAEDFAAGVADAVEAQRLQREAVAQADADYQAHKLNPQGARLSWGSYHVSGAFHFVSSTYARMRQRSNGSWLCNTCWQPASTENNRPECHRCSDWNGCGNDCTLSRVYCDPCGTKLEIG